MVHDSILELDSEFISEFLFFPIVLSVLTKNSSISGDDVVQGNGIVLTEQPHFDVVDLLPEHWAAFLDFTHLVPHNIEESNRHLAPCVDINLVFHDERPMVDHTASVQSFDDELYTVVHRCVDFNHTVLDNLHHVRRLFNLENLGALIELGEGHREDYLVNGLIWDISQVVNCLQGTLQENLEVVVVTDGQLYQFFFVLRVSVKEVEYFSLWDLAKGRVVG
mmetsp:Transcript_3612/g.5446  ORF Transcript_3612/g.5446 Transcript_3612/m.5446 type:complete len:221 (-) Transcript_3612:476-1138(-)